MSKRSIFAALLLSLFCALQAETDGTYSLLILPVRQTVADEQFSYLKAVIARILALYLGDQKNISLADTNGVEAFDVADFSGQLKLMESVRGLDLYLITEYWAAAGKLHIAVTVVEAGSGRAKGCFTRSMPTDLDMIRNIEDMSKSVAKSVSLSLPQPARAEILSRQAQSGLREQLDREDALVASIFKSGSEISVSPCLGISTGSSLLSWSGVGPLIGLPLALEYTYRDHAGWHLRLGGQWLPFDLMQPSVARMEASAEILGGGQTSSLVSLSWDAGISASWSRNGAAGALAYLDGAARVFPPAERFSFGIPLEAGVSFYGDHFWFAQVRLKYHGLSWVLEPLAPSEYPEGQRIYLYRYGFSPWSLATFSIVASWGIRL